MPINTLSKTRIVEMVDFMGVFNEEECRVYKDLEKRKAFMREYRIKHKEELKIAREKKRIEKYGHPIKPRPKYTPEQRKEVVKACYTKRMKERREWYENIKKNLRCERCDEFTPICLDFHHIDPTTKERSAHTRTIGVSAMIGRKKETILAEIAKCIVLCANCHRKEHARLKTEVE